MENHEKLTNWAKIDIEKLVENLDYDQIHFLQITLHQGEQIIIWEDGTIITMDANSWPNTDRWYATIKAFGPSDVEDYFDTPRPPAGRIEEEIKEAISYGEWSEHYQGIENHIRRQYENDIQNLEDLIQEV